MSTRDSPRLRGARRAKFLLRRLGAEASQARIEAGLSLRQVGVSTGVSYTQVWRIERGEAPHVDLDVLARVAEVVGHELALGIHPVATPVRDRAHLALLGRLCARLHPSLAWRTEVPVAVPGDRRSADATVSGPIFAALVEAETRLVDVQATERRVAVKARDLGLTRVLLLVLDSRHNREVIRQTPPWLNGSPSVPGRRSARCPREWTPAETA